MPDEPGNPFTPWVLPVLAALVVLAIFIWNIDTTHGLPVTNPALARNDWPGQSQMGQRQDELLQAGHAFHSQIDFAGRSVGRIGRS